LLKLLSPGPHLA